MTFEGLVGAIQEKTGMSTNDLSEEQILRVGRALNLELPLKVELVEYTNKAGNTAEYVKTSNFTIPGTDQTAKGLFVRAEVIDDAIEALQTAKAMLAASEHDGEG